MDKVKEEMIKAEEKGEENIDYVSKAQAIAERLEQANKRTEELLQRQERLKAQEILGGKSDMSKPVQKEEQSPQEYAQNALKGVILK